MDRLSGRTVASRLRLAIAQLSAVLIIVVAVLLSIALGKGIADDPWTATSRDSGPQLRSHAMAHITDFFVFATSARFAGQEQCGISVVAKMGSWGKGRRGPPTWLVLTRNLRLRFAGSRESRAGAENCELEGCCDIT